MARLCGVKDPDGAHWRASYNIIGELTSLTDPPPG
ncbi:RHS-family protein [Cutibacterium acnes 19B1]|nr:RHS-family protein [Cutibacterium acnes 19B1]